MVWRVSVIASPTYFNRFTASVAFSLETSDGVTNGSGKTGPCQTKSQSKFEISEAKSLYLSFYST